MKVNMEKDYRQYYTMIDVENAKEIIKMEKEDDENKAKDWAEYAVNEALKGTDDFLRDIIEASAETAKNCRAWNEYGEGTADMDVWIRCTARTADGYIEVGAYLSDIWKTGAEEYRQHEYIDYFKRASLNA